jgi:UDP-glucose 4-epimerase
MLLVTGGLGYIGTHVAHLLGTDVVVIDDLSRGTMENRIHGTQFVQCDITNVEELERVFETYPIDTVVHVAGKAFVQESFESVDSYYSVNVVGTIHVLNMMVKYNVRNIIFSSSCSVYGNADAFPITESTPRNPVSPYGTTKKMCEDIITEYSATKGLRHVILRYFNVAGNVCAHETPHNTTRIVPTIINAGLHHKTLSIYGKDCKTTDGTCARSYIHVADLAEAHVKAVEYLAQNGDNLVCNLGGTDTCTVLELVHMVSEKLGTYIQYEYNDRRSGDPDIVFCENELATSRLHWKPTRTIHDIIDSSISGRI